MKETLYAKIKEVRETRLSMLMKREELMRLIQNYQQEVLTIDRQVVQIDGAVEGMSFAIGLIMPDAEPQKAQRGRPRLKRWKPQVETMNTHHDREVQEEEAA